MQDFIVLVAPFLQILLMERQEIVALQAIIVQLKARRLHRALQEAIVILQVDRVRMIALHAAVDFIVTELA